MKNIFKGLLFLFIIWITLESTNAINVVNSNTRTNSCAWANVNAIYYITWNSYDRFLGDMFSTPDDRLISDQQTKVTIWSSDNNLLSGCTNSSDWSRLSSLSPWSNTNVLALWANCTFNKPSNPSNRTLQFVYNVGYYDIFSWNWQLVWDWPLAYFLNQSEVNNNTPHIVPYTNVGFDNLNIHNNECFNVELRYCWDGIVSNWETCDDTNNINWDWCSSTCNTEVPPVTSSSSSSSSSSSWGGSSSGWWSNYCWDGIVQRPNSNLEMEECDFWSESDWLFCNSNCTYSNLTLPGTCDPAVNNCNITIPNGWSIDFWPSDNVIIWAWMNPYIAHSLGKPYVQNNSDYDMYFDKLCVVDRNWSTLIWSTICENLWILRSGEIKYFSTTPNFVWAVVNTWDYADNTLVTTVEQDWTRYDNAYFVAKLDVRVAQSSVATTWWWTSYLASGNSVWDISNISNNWNLDPAKNKNFVWVWVSWWNASSYSKEINNTSSVSTIASDWDNQNSWINNLSEVIWTTLWNTNSLSDFENYNWIENVFILKNKNFVINNDVLAWLSWARTYIVENWDLRINYDINYNDNIAFVVKWGNISIHKSVNNIDWTYITIIKNSVWWKFIWVWWVTTNRLLVNGSLYWNIDQLISTRTYVKQNSFNQIDVWTIVSFGSSLFRKTAPLLSTFINEYLESEKIAQ